MAVIWLYTSNTLQRGYLAVRGSTRSNHTDEIDHTSNVQGWYIVLITTICIYLLSLAGLQKERPRPVGWNIWQWMYVILAEAWKVALRTKLRRRQRYSPCRPTGPKIQLQEVRVTTVCFLHRDFDLKSPQVACIDMVSQRKSVVDHDTNSRRSCNHFQCARYNG